VERQAPAVALSIERCVVRVIRARAGVATLTRIAAYAPPLNVRHLPANNRGFSSR